jgi:hypothetical protein
MKKITLIITCLFLLFSVTGNCSATYTLEVVVYGNPSTMYEINSTGYSINSEVKDYGVWMATPSIHIAIIDSSSCIPVSNCNKDFGQFNIFYDPDGDCIVDANTVHTTRSRAENYFIYRDNDVTAIQHMAHLLDSVANGHIIIAYSVFPYEFSTMDTAFKNVFQRLGSTLIPLISDTVPFIFVCRKGDAASVHEVTGSVSDDSIGISMTYQCSPTGIDDHDANVLRIYPNPVSDKLHIGLQKDFSKGEIKIFDALGNLVAEQKYSEGDLIINTEKFSAGLYFVILESGNYNSTVRFCKVE